MEDHTNKPTVTISDDTIEWLIDTYPDALSTQEAIRMAISDARMLHEYRAVYENIRMESD